MNVKEVRGKIPKPFITLLDSFKKIAFGDNSNTIFSPYLWTVPKGTPADSGVEKFYTLAGTSTLTGTSTFLHHKKVERAGSSSVRPRNFGVSSLEMKKQPFKELLTKV